MNEYNHKYMVVLIISLLMVTITAHAFNGKVTDKDTGSPLGFANVTLHRSDSTFMSGTVTDMDGNFSLQTEETPVFVKVTSPGYTETWFSLVGTDMSPIQLKVEKAGTTLSGITVRGRQRPFTFNDGTLTFNPTFVPYATNAYDIIRVAPGVIDTGNTLSMPSKEGIKILIDGKEQKGTLSDILNLLKSYQASEVQSVEIMQAPKARYSRGANIGVINIRLRKHTLDYLGGSAGYYFGADPKITNSLSAGLNYRSRKVTTSFNAYGKIQNYKFDESGALYAGDYMRRTLSGMDRNTKSMVLRWYLDYIISSGWTASVTALYSGSNMRHDSEARDTYYYTTDSQLYEQTSRGYRHEKSSGASLSAEVTGSLSSKTTLTASVDYYDKSYPTLRRETTPEGAIDFSQDNAQNVSATVGRVGLSVDPTSKLSLEFGADYSFTRTRTSADYFFQGEGDFLQKFRYLENELDIFGQVSWSPTNRIYVTGTLRYQNLLLRSWNMFNVEENFRRHTDVLSPKVYVSYRFNDINSISANFYYNMSKPTLMSMNPSILYVGNNVWRQGNPNLREARHFMVSTTYTHRGLMVEPYYEQLDHGVMETGSSNGDGEILYTWDNSLSRKTAGLFVYWGWSGLEWMSLNSTQTILYVHTQTSSDNLCRSADTFSYSIYPSLSFFIDKRKRYSFTVRGKFMSARKEVEFEMRPRWDMTVDFNWRPDRHWSVAVSADNLLVSKNRGTFNLTNSEIVFANRYEHRGVSFSVSYNWGVSTRYKREREVKRKMDTRTEMD